MLNLLGRAFASAAPLDVEADYNSTIEARNSPLTITLYFDDHCGDTVGETPGGDPISKVQYTGDDSTYMKCQKSLPPGLLSYKLSGGPTLDCGDPAQHESKVWQVFNGPSCKGDGQVNTDQCKATACTSALEADPPPNSAVDAILRHVLRIENPPLWNWGVDGRLLDTILHSLLFTYAC